jgi:hypothetical protein
MKKSKLWFLFFTLGLAFLALGIPNEAEPSPNPTEIRAELIRTIPDFQIEKFDSYWWEHLLPLEVQGPKGGGPLTPEYNGEEARAIQEALEKAGFFAPYQPTAEGLDQHFAKVLWSLGKEPLEKLPTTPDQCRGAYERYLGLYGKDTPSGKIPWEDKLCDWNELTISASGR